MLLNRREWPILWVNVAYLCIFSIVALRDIDLEFLLYTVVIVVAALLVLMKQRLLRFSTALLWGLTLWGFLHLAGGNLPVGESVLYDVVVVPLIGEPYHILGYDQVVHMFGFGMATLVCHHLLVPDLCEPRNLSIKMALLILLMGAGVGALNEIIEFVAVLLVPQTGVGGYHNTMLDLVFNFIGGGFVVGWLWLQGRLSNRSL